MVRDRASLPGTIALALAGVLALGGCGSSKTTTMSVSSGASPSEAHARTAPSQTAGLGRTAPSKSKPTETQSTATSTRAAPAPAFVVQDKGEEGLSVALHVVEEHGFTASDTATYRSGQTLRVLLGTRASSGGGYDQQAFFFEDGHYLGTDASKPSAALKVIGQTDTEVTLSYSLYGLHDAPCCPKGGAAKVRFQLDNGRLQALDPIPPASSASGPSRR
jgi:hypothetical protein